MRIELKAWLAVLGTLVVGIVLGMLLNGAMERRRHDRLETMRRPGGFVEEMERVIQPRSAAQRDSLRPYLEEADQRNRAIVDGARTSMRAELDSLSAHISGMLDADQKARFADFLQRGPPNGGGPGGIGGRRGPPPRDGRGPPPDGPPGFGGPPPPP